MKTILVVSYSYYPRISGVSEIVAQTYKGLLLAKAVDKVVLFCADTEQTGIMETEIDGILVFRFKVKSLLNGRVPLVSREMFEKLDFLIATFKPSQIHNHTRFQFLSWFSLRKGIKNNIPVVHVEYLANFVNGESIAVNFLCWLWDVTISSYLMRKSSLVVATSESIADFLKGSLGIPNAVVIPNASTIVPLPVRYSDKFNDIMEFNLVYVGRFVKLKNTLIIIKAIHILKKRKLSFHLHLAGDGSLKAQVLELIKLNELDDVITYLGKIEKHEVSNLLAKTHLFLNPSCIEGLPNTVLEALSTTNMVIATNIGGNKDLIKVNDCLIPLEKLTPEVLADKIEDVIANHKKYIPQFEENKQFVIKNFSWENVVSLYKSKILSAPV